MVGQAAIGVDHREVSLVFLHYADQDLRRQVLQITRVKTTQQRSRSFDQVAYFFQQVGVFRQGSTCFFRKGDRLLPDCLTPLRGVEDDALSV